MSVFLERLKRVLPVLAPVFILLALGFLLESCVRNNWTGRVSNIIHAGNIERRNSSGPPNMVDERFELLSLIFRLAGRGEFNDIYSLHQQRISRQFYRSRNHEAVLYASKLSIGYDAVFLYAVHMEKNKYGVFIIDNMESLLNDGRWSRETVDEFLALINKFYIASNFAGYYHSNINYYKAESSRLMEETFQYINYEWFDPYIYPLELRIIYSPSGTRFNYGAIFNGEVYYAAISGDGSAVIHEFCHSFANGIAEKLYNENLEFKSWSDDSVNPSKLPHYAHGTIMGIEYVTRAYTILYEVENGRLLLPLLLQEYSQGFPYMENVYALITQHEIIKRDKQEIKISILGNDFEMGDEVSIETEDSSFVYRPLFVSSLQLDAFKHTEISDKFGTKTGDILYVDDSFLLIDLGETSFYEARGYRKYSMIPLPEDL